MRYAALLICVIVLGCNKPAPSTTSAKPPTRDELREQLIGKTPDEVLKILGKPESTTERADGKPDSWRYKRKSYDPISNKIDEYMHVWFDRDGKVERLNY